MAAADEAGHRVEREPVLVDHRRVSKVPTVSGRRHDFEEWVFPFESYCCLLGWDTLVAACRETGSAIETVSLSPETENIGRSLYHLLVSVTKGTALSIVKLTDRGNGFEALRRLYYEYRPRLNEEHGSLLQMAPTPTWCRSALAASSSRRL